MNSKNEIPYLYDSLWRDYLITYYNFSNYNLIKDLSKFNNDIRIIILIFEKDDKQFLFGFRDGILFPYLNNINILHFNQDKYKNKIIDILHEIVIEIKIYYNNPIKMYNYPYYQLKNNFDIFKFIGFNSNNVFDCFNLISDDILLNMKSNIKNTINKFNKKKIFIDEEINIYYGEISNDVFDIFIKKHFELSGRKTKHDDSWEILKMFIILKKAFLVRYDNDFVYFFISTNFSYYGINAVTKKSDICTILIYKAFEFLRTNNCLIVYMDKYDHNNIDEKICNLSFFKKSLSNKLIDNYYTIFD